MSSSLPIGRAAFSFAIIITIATFLTSPAASAARTPGIATTIIQPVRSVHYASRELAAEQLKQSQGNPYNGTTNAIPGLFQNIFAVTYDSDYHELIVAENNSTFTTIARVAPNGHATTIATLPNFVRALAYDSTTKIVYVGTACIVAAVAPSSGATQVVAGSGTCGTADGQGAAAQFQGPAGIAVDPTGRRLYVTDVDRVRTVTVGGAVTTLTAPGSLGGGGGQCSFNTGNQGIAFDPIDGNLYVADSCPNLVRRVAIATGKVTTAAGQCIRDQFFSCQQFDRDGTKYLALFAAPGAIAYSQSDQKLYVADTGNNQIREFRPISGDVRPLAGSGHAEFVNGIGNLAGFNAPTSLAILPNGLIYVADSGNTSIRTVVSGGPPAPPPVHGIALSDPEALGAQPFGVTATGDGSLWYSEFNYGKIVHVDPTGHNHIFRLPQLNYPLDLASDASGNVWFADAQGPLNFFQSYAVGVVRADGRTKIYAVPSSSAITSVTIGPDGNAWFTMPATGALGTVDSKGVVTEFAVDAPGFVAPGFSMDLWTIGQGFIDRFSASAVLLKKYAYAGIFPGPISKGPALRMWFAQPQAVGEVFASDVAMFQLPPASNQFNSWLPMGIVQGPDGAAWFTASSVGDLGRMTVNGDFTAYEVPTARSRPNRITVAPNGTMWFTDPSGSKIGRWF